MKRPYYIAYYDKTLGERDEAGTPVGKWLHLGSAEGAWYSDYQSAKHFSKPEIKKVLPTIKRQYKDKKLKVIKILTMEV
jgi:hypothetical protein